jgi:hypothetical protein
VGTSATRAPGGSLADPAFGAAPSHGKNSCRDFCHRGEAANLAFRSSTWGGTVNSEEMSPFPKCTRSVEGGCSRVDVGCVRLTPRSSAPVKRPLATEPRASAGLPAFVSALCRTPRSNPPCSPVRTSWCLGSRTPCWRSPLRRTTRAVAPAIVPLSQRRVRLSLTAPAAPASCARVEGECRLRGAGARPRPGPPWASVCAPCCIGMLHRQSRILVLVAWPPSRRRSALIFGRLTPPSLVRGSATALPRIDQTLPCSRERTDLSSPAKHQLAGGETIDAPRACTA